MSNELLGCPWCSGEPVIEFWHGGGPQKRMIGCRNEECSAAPSFSAPTKAKAIAAWNRRTLPAAERDAARNELAETQMDRDYWRAIADGSWPSADEIIARVREKRRAAAIKASEGTTTPGLSVKDQGKADK